MRQLSHTELLSLSELLTLEKNVLASNRMIRDSVTDKDLERQLEAGILASEERIKGIQQFIIENKLIDIEEEK